VTHHKKQSCLKLKTETDQQHRQAAVTNVTVAVSSHTRREKNTDERMQVCGMFLSK